MHAFRNKDMTGKENTQMGDKGDWGDKRMKNEQEKREEATRDEAAEMERGERGQWANKTEFLLSMLGSMVGLGNVWRFPYLCYKNGGGVFLVPYVLLAVTCGVPLFLLESSIGQYTQQGLITCWRRLCPLAEGIGYGGLMVQLYSCVCYIIILAWALLYLIFSFSSQLPWASCTNTWNTASCIDLKTLNLTANWVHQSNNTNAATEFWDFCPPDIECWESQGALSRWAASDGS
ncbi:hypothetical protein AGOR_G00026210 [Albula goreensis]|uniref:Transporter n=1 Tax=Albula goreensis TaxID=1534307 RepID=A0A8T3E284_9TELE|nr:hypothetical protein AGOR_G00026210 [Albula goreensis]